MNTFGKGPHDYIWRRCVLATMWQDQGGKWVQNLNFPHFGEGHRNCIFIDIFSRHKSAKTFSSTFIGHGTMLFNPTKRHVQLPSPALMLHLPSYLNDFLGALSEGSGGPCVVTASFPFFFFRLNSRARKSEFPL